MTRRFWSAMFFTVSLFLIAMSHMGHGMSLGWFSTGVSSPWIELVLSTPVVFWCGWPILARAFQSVTSRNLNMFILIGIGVGAAWIYSLIATLFPDVFPVSFRTEGGQVSVYFETAGVIITLVLMGQVLEIRVRKGARAR